jgi:hypothetical protein
MIRLPVRDVHQQLAEDHLGPAFWDAVEGILVAPLPEREAFPRGICRADDCDNEVPPTGKRGRPPTWCRPEHEKPAKAAYARWYRASNAAEGMSREERQDAVYGLMNEHLAPLVRKFHDRSFDGWMTIAEQKAEAQRQYKELGIKVVANTEANRERYAVEYVSALQRGREPREFYEDYSGEWLVVETDPLIMPLELPWDESRLVADSSGRAQLGDWGNDDDDDDEPPHERAADVGVPIEHMIADAEDNWYADDMSERAARYGAEYHGWEWNRRKQRHEPRFQVMTPIGDADATEKHYQDAVTPWVHPKAAADWLAEQDRDERNKPYAHPA